MNLSRRNLFLILLAVVAVFQVASIFSLHIEGDELVYLSLSQNMGWDFSNYTVMNNHPLNEFPNRLYRAEVFIHPPLFPFILKMGSNLVNPVLFGLIFNGLLKLALAIFMWRFALVLGVRQSAACFCAIFVTACPILGFIGSRILVDMGFAFSLIMVIFFLIRAGIEQAQKNLLVAIICCCVLLNIKLQALAYLPLFIFLYIVAVRNARRRGELTLISLRYSVLWGIILIGTIGFVHYYHLIYNLGIHDTLRLFDVERPLNPFITRIANRSTSGFIVYLVILHPIVLLLMRPQIWLALRKTPGGITDSLICLAVVIIYSVVVTLFSSGAQERYWAHIFPLVFLLIVVMYEKIRNYQLSMEINPRIVYAGYLILLFMNNYETNILLAGSRTAIVFPAIFKLFPFLAMPGGPFFNF